jgi:hypothetical protein
MVGLREIKELKEIEGDKEILWSSKYLVNLNGSTI